MRFRLSLIATLLATSAALSAAGAQDVTGACTTPDTIVVRGNTRISAGTILSDAGLTTGVPLNYRVVQRAIRSLFATNQYDDVRIDCAVDPASNRATYVIAVRERPVLGDIDVTGVEALSPRTVKERVDLLIGRPIDPAQVAHIITRIDSLYEAEGYYLARVRADTSEANGKTKLTFHVDEGRRLAISGIEILGNQRLSDAQIVGAMKTKPEGFFWFRRGEFDEDKFAADLGEKVPQLYASRGFVDFQVLRDTLIVDRERGKAKIEITVTEGPQYKVGSFDVLGNHRFSTDDIRRFYPFADESPTITQRVTELVRRGDTPKDVFDESKWDEATQRVSTAYHNEGYIYASVRPVLERTVGPDSTPVLNLRWEIEERDPAIINRIEIAGNDYTTESCIRDQLVILPGDVFNQDRLIRSYQNIGNLGFFETPMPPPDTRQANDKGDVDVVFTVKEKKTGNVNFGASVGQGTGIGGFIGLDQPNLFGQCKRGSLQWQFGQYINDFNLSYTDPAIRQSRIQGTVTAYRSRSRYILQDLGRLTRTGAQLQLGFPVPHSPFTRLFVSYGGEAVDYGGDANDLLTSVATTCNNCFRSTLGLTATRDTRIDLPFATAGSYQTTGAQFTGGPLGGTSSFQRYTTEVRAYSPLGQVGGTKPGSQPIKFVLGLTARGGALFGSPGPFFSTQGFALGGTQYGEQLRGYPEFCITPTQGPVATRGDQCTPFRTSFGSAFFTTTAEMGVRFNQMFYLNTFLDAGNVWAHPRDFDLTHLYRGAGIGLSTVTPLGPLGLDWAYGFDRVDALGRPDPKWMLHFKLGQFF